MDVVKGKDVLFQLLYEGSYKDFLCATDCSLEVTTELKSVFTAGDGQWSKSKPQKLSYTIAVNGLIVLTHPFFALQSQIDYVEIDYRMIFTDTSDGSQKVVMGAALVERSLFSAPSDGFAAFNMTLQGNGAFTISNSTTLCASSIGAVTVTLYTGDGGLPPNTVTVSYSGLTAGTPRIEWTLDGGARNVHFTGGATAGVFYISPGTGTHTLLLYPVCENGYDGTVFTKNYTV